MSVRNLFELILFLYKRSKNITFLALWIVSLCVCNNIELNVNYIAIESISFVKHTIHLRYHFISPPRQTAKNVTF